MINAADQAASRLPEHSAVVIIGAGPAGLALGRELQQRRIRFIILEKGSVADSWSRMPRELKLISPWKCNWLHHGSKDCFKPNAQLTRREFNDYLREFAATNRLPVVTNCPVLSIERIDEEFRVKTNDGTIAASILVNATGYFSNPIVPRFPGEEECHVPRIHYAQHGDVTKVVSLAGRNASVLIVGKRLSAGQVALQLVDAGVRVMISHRSPIRFGVSEWVWPLVYRTFAGIEAMKLRVPSKRFVKLDVPMAGGRMRKLVESGKIQTFPGISHIEREQIFFEDGSRVSPCVIFYATGFAPTLDFLAPLHLAVEPSTGVPVTRDMESVSTPNLFFLGFELLRNFQSRFLRGIRQDAVWLARIIEDRSRRLRQTAVAEVGAA